MAGPAIGSQGIITSWTGTNNTQLISALGEYNFQWQEDGGTADRTAYAATTYSRAHGPGLRSWNGTITGRLLSTATPQVGGYAGNIGFGGSDMYATNVLSYSITLAAGEHDITPYNAAATTAGWKSFRPGLISLSGTYEALVDVTTPIKNLFTSSTSLPTATFTLTSGNSIQCSIVPTQLSEGMPVGDLIKITYGFQSSGAITIATGDDVNLFDATTNLVTPEWDADTDGVGDTTLTWAAVSGSRTRAGAAFWTSVGITHNPANYTDVAVAFRGTGALTIA